MDRRTVIALEGDAPPSAGVYLFAPLFFALTLWCWHLPKFYDATLENNYVYWAMHLSLFGAALALWRVLLDDQTDF
ncbi:MAG: hypothetical protein JWM91_4398 [Rhodospirillales bacterium]|nr:hypothetical protein [Rhodospirillales bacterium]